MAAWDVGVATVSPLRQRLSVRVRSSTQALALALSMTIQRYALAHPKDRIPYCGLELKKQTVWSVGLLFYIAANGLKVVGLMFGPMTAPRPGRKSGSGARPRRETGRPERGQQHGGAESRRSARARRCSPPSSPRCSSSTC